MTLRATAALVFICGTALASLNAQEAPSGRSEADEFQKLAPALKFLRTRNTRNYAVTTPNGIDEANYVKIGGLEQWITIRGEDRKNPVLLFLHGGPGDATNPWGYAVFATGWSIPQSFNGINGVPEELSDETERRPPPPSRSSGWLRTASSLRNCCRRGCRRTKSFSSGIPGAPS